MKKSITLILLSFVSCYCFSQAGEWTWMNGDSVYDSQGYFGIQGIPGPLNTPPALFTGKLLAVWWELKR
jgi:hypothetical protein